MQCAIVHPKSVAEMMNDISLMMMLHGCAICATGQHVGHDVDDGSLIWLNSKMTVLSIAAK